MTKKLAFASLFLAVAFGGVAFAQTAWVEIDDDVVVAPLNKEADDVEDWDVIGSDGAKLGEVEEVIGTQAGTASALVVEFEDGSIFDRDREVIVPLDQFSFADDKLTLNADAAAVGTMELYKDD